MTLPAWHLHPDVWLLFGSIVAGYLVLVSRHAASTGEPVRTRQRALFLGGMAALWIGSDWPMHDLAEGYLYSAHMVQHMLYTLVAAPLLVSGIPAWMWRAVIRPAPLRAVWRTLTRPVVALAFFNGVLLFTHWPAVVEASVGSELAHFSLHVLVVFSAVVMWWPIVSPLPEMPPITPPAQMMYLFVQSLVPTIPASFLTFGETPLYPIYETFPRIWELSAMTDQLVAGLIMKLIGGAILWVVIGCVFFKWANHERDGWDALAYRDVERDVHAELTR